MLQVKINPNEKVWQSYVRPNFICFLYRVLFVFGLIELEHETPDQMTSCILADTFCLLYLPEISMSKIICVLVFAGMHILL